MDEEKQLTDETIYPDEDVLRGVLGRSFGAYLDLLSIYDDNGLVYEWRYYQDGKSWLCKVQKKSKTIVWMSAWRGYIKSAIYVTERLVPELLDLAISDHTKETIVGEKNIGKLKPCIFDIRNKKSIKDFEKVMQFKIKVK